MAYLGIPRGIMGVYTNWIMELLSKDNYRLKKQNELLKDMIIKFKNGEIKKKEFVQEFDLFINKNNKV